MKIEKGLIEFNNGFIISYWQQWYELFRWKKYNWNDFDLLHVQFENDIMTGAYEFTLVLFLLGITIRVPHETEKGKKFWKRTSASLKRLKESCYGWVNPKIYKSFRNKQIKLMLISNIKDKNVTKKIFIQ